MKNLLILLIIIVAVYKGWEYYGKQDSPAPLYDKPYVVVYGRDSCGWTQKMLKDLHASGIKYSYMIVDKREVADTLHARMTQSGLDTRRYNLPVVDVNGEIFIRPDVTVVITRYNSVD
jgi:glutaredoxin